MEYYFSDSNLLHDKFMKNLLSQNSKGSKHSLILHILGFISIGIFLSFNKIKSLLE